MAEGEGGEEGGEGEGGMVMVAFATMSCLAVFLGGGGE